MLLDRDHVITERYSLVNVPTVVWIDEDDQVVRPNDVAFSDDQFKEFHGIDSKPHLEALRRWVLDDELPLGDPDEVREHQMPPTDDEQRARLEFRLALHLRRDDRTEAADAHFDRAIALAPMDFTIRRAAMPLRGEDPFFGESFLELYEEWEAIGRPYYVPRDPAPTVEPDPPRRLSRQRGLLGWRRLPLSGLGADARGTCRRSAPVEPLACGGPLACRCGRRRVWRVARRACPAGLARAWLARAAAWLPSSAGAADGSPVVRSDRGLDRARRGGRDGRSPATVAAAASRPRGPSDE